MGLEMEDVREALAKWADFPVAREPRPVVLTSMSALELDRLKNDAAWRTVFGGPGVSEAELPSELRPELSHYYRDLGEVPEPLPRIVRALGPFATDRGFQQLPAWMMYPDARRWPFIALDPEFRRRMTWRPESIGDDAATEESVLSGDGRTLTYRFMGTPAVYAAYPHAEVFETDTAVLVDPVEVALDSPYGARFAYAEEREVVVRLDAPLGNRVLISLPRNVAPDRRGTPRRVIVSP